ncbi:MAG: YCF48-related protein [Bacteroidales bacterium]|nr:YCF48-related protein [Bacteroidales bacterium]
MKKFLFPLLLIFLFIAFLSAFPAHAERWEMTRIPRDRELSAVHFPTRDVGYAVGGDGIIVKTTDGGKTWEVLSENTYYDLRGVYFINEKTGFVYQMASNNKMWRTADGGKTWSKSEGPFRYCAYFFDDKKGFAGTDRTTDGGITWTKSNWHPDGKRWDVQSVTFIDPSTGFAVGYEWKDGVYKGHVLKTTDGGINWIEQEFGNINAAFRSVSFVDEKNGYIVGGKYNPDGDDRKGVLLKTTDGGLTWKKSVILTESTDNYLFYTAVFTEKGTGYISSSAIYKTTDDGATWSKDFYSNIFFPKDLFLHDTRTGVVVGTNGYVVRLIDNTPIDETNADVLPTAFPNPARGTVTLPFDGNGADAMLRIFNAGGRLVKEVNADGGLKSVAVDVSGFDAGLYFYSCNGKSGRFFVE